MAYLKSDPNVIYNENDIQNAYTYCTFVNQQLSTISGHENCWGTLRTRTAAEWKSLADDAYNTYTIKAADYNNYYSAYTSAEWYMNYYYGLANSEYATATNCANTAAWYSGQAAACIADAPYSCCCACECQGYANYYSNKAADCQCCACCAKYIRDNLHGSEGACSGIAAAYDCLTCRMCCCAAAADSYNSRSWCCSVCASYYSGKYIEDIGCFVTFTVCSNDYCGQATAHSTLGDTYTGYGNSCKSSCETYYNTAVSCAQARDSAYNTYVTYRDYYIVKCAYENLEPYGSIVDGGGMSTTFANGLVYITVLSG